MTVARLVEVGDGTRISCTLEGPGDAPVIVLAHSLGSDSAAWEAQAAALRDRFRVLRYDSRGHGASDAPAGAYGIDRLGRDAVELLDGLGLDRVAFCGVSMGGMVGQWLGAREPQRLSALILANTSARLGPPSTWQARIDEVVQGGTAAVAEAVTARWFTPAFREREPEAAAAAAATLRATSAAGYAGCCCAIRDMDQRAAASAIAVRTLVVAGAHDAATPLAHARFLSDAIPGATLTVLDAAHLSNIEAAEAFTGLLRPWLRDAQSAPAAR